METTRKDRRTIDSTEADGAVKLNGKTNSSARLIGSLAGKSHPAHGLPCLSLLAICRLFRIAARRRQSRVSIDGVGVVFPIATAPRSIHWLSDCRCSYLGLSPHPIRQRIRNRRAWLCPSATWPNATCCCNRTRGRVAETRAMKTFTSMCSQRNTKPLPSIEGSAANQKRTPNTTRQPNRRLANSGLTSNRLVLGHNGALTKVLGQNTGRHHPTPLEPGAVKTS